MNSLYFECKKCGCLQIAEIPKNISKYYPSNYYSYFTPTSQIKSKLFEFFKRKRDHYEIFKKGILGNLISKFLPNISFQILSEITITKNSKILDVGCGSGGLLYKLKNIGFNNTLGIDPFIANDITYDNGLHIHKKMFNDVMEKQDLIMFHHSFEHMSNPIETLEKASKLLNKGGCCMIRIPTVSSFAWKHYRENWVQLDAPRHFFLHSEESIGLIAKKVSLTVEKVVYDSTDFQFTGSERYLKDIPLRDKIEETELFSNEEIQTFKRRSIELNKQQNGDA